MYGESQFYTPYEQDTPYGMSQNVPYGMGQNFPQPMGDMNSMQQGYPSMGLPFSNNNQMPQNYARGGSVSRNTLSRALNHARGMGEDEDQILAHINPQEAQELYERHGGDINPRTGLPQFGKFSRMFKRVLPTLVRTAAATIGTMVGGPAAGTAAAALASGIMEKSKGGKFGKGLVKGAIHGGLQSYGLPMAGNAMGVSPTGPTGTFMGMNTPSAGNLGSTLFGAPNAGASAGRAEAFKALGGAGGSQGASPGGLQGLLSGNNINKALLATSILGTLGAKYKTPKEPSLQDVINSGPSWGADQPSRNTNPMQMSLRHFDPNKYKAGFEPEMMYFENSNPLARYASGGHVQAFEGEGGGQSDGLPVPLHEGDFIVEASTASDLGDGNPREGAVQIQNLVQEAMNGKNYKSGGSAKKIVPAMVSPTEVRISKEGVDAIGKGSNAKGAASLKKMVKNVRKHKRSNASGLPPKAKNIKSYLGSK